MNKKFSLYKLLETYDIIIPSIQRDYAHGRTTRQAGDIRERLVSDFIRSTFEGAERLNLDFIYGRIDNNTFIPFDGQQRLTTLFLFNRYIFEKFSSNDDEWRKVLIKFSYQTRAAAREFTKSLSEENHCILNKASELNEASELAIEDQKWFRVEWREDPTVSGMIMTLKTIHEKLKDKQFSDDEISTIIQNLKSVHQSPIIFYYLDMPKYDLSDDAYVTINARGKELTPWEKFKSHLHQFYHQYTGENEEMKQYIDNVFKQLDGDYLDFFYNYTVAHSDNESNQDDYMMSIVQLFLYNEQIRFFCNNDGNLQIASGTLLDIPCATKAKYIPFSDYKVILSKICKSHNSLDPLKPVFSFWKFLQKYNANQLPSLIPNNYSCANWDIVNVTKYNNKERLAFFALLLYFESGINLEDDKELVIIQQWMRFIWNILENSQISTTNYFSYLSLFWDLKQQILSRECAPITKEKHLWTNIRNYSIGNNSPAHHQLIEEKKKCSLLIDGMLSIDELNDFETHVYLRGKIRCLFPSDSNLTSDTYSNDFVQEIHNRFKWLETFVNHVNNNREQTLWKLTKSIYDDSCRDARPWVMFSLVFPSKRGQEDWQSFLYNKLWPTTTEKILSGQFFSDGDNHGPQHRDYGSEYMNVLSNIYEYVFNESHYFILWSIDNQVYSRSSSSGKRSTSVRLDYFSELQYLLYHEISPGEWLRNIYDITKLESGPYCIAIKDSNTSPEKWVKRVICAHCLKKNKGNDFKETLSKLFSRTDNC